MINFISSLPSTTAALDAERTRLQVIAQNIANANTTHGLDGRPYHRQQVVFETVLQNARTQAGCAGPQSGPRVSRIQNDPRPGRATGSSPRPPAKP